MLIRLALLASSLLLFASAADEKPKMSGLVGAPVAQKTDDAEHMERAWKAVNGQLNDPANNNGQYHFIPIKILKAASQVVAGIKYDYELLVGESTCKKGEVQNTELSAVNCQLLDNGRRAIYKLAVWEKPWEKFAQYDIEKVRDVAADESI